MNIAYREAFASLQTNPCPRRRVVPPNRLETSNWDLLVEMARRPAIDPRTELRATLQKILRREKIIFVPSARCAIAQILAHLPGDEVVMPAFNCDVVKSAVQAAGKRIIYVDLAKGSVNATAAEFSTEAQPGRILLITHQFGVPTDVEAICDLARSRGCITIEDAACCFGGMRDGQPLGTFADFGVFSFESWKRFPAFRGGVIAINNERVMDFATLQKTPFVTTALKRPTREAMSALGRNVATIPWLYGRLVLPILLRSYLKPLIPAPVPTAEESVTNGSPFTREFHPYQAQLVTRMLGRSGEIRRHIAHLVSVYTGAFRAGPVATFLPARCDDAGLLRFPIAIPAGSRAEVLRQALRRGIYLETEFEQPLPEPAELSRFPNATWTGHNLILLPLYSTLLIKDATWLASQIKEIASSCGRPAAPAAQSAVQQS